MIIGRKVFIINWNSISTNQVLDPVPRQQARVNGKLEKPR